MPKKTALASALLALASSSALAQDTPPKPGDMVFHDVGFEGLDLNPSGQYLLRYRHFEGHDFVSGGNADTVRHRARLGLGATYAGKVGGMVQLQDVRTFGEERDTLGDYSADGLDLHQAYLRAMPAEGFELRLGRQEIAFENHRLIGTVGWIEQARSFDAARAMFEHGMLRIDSFYAKVAEDASATTNDDGSPFHGDDVDLLAANLHLAAAKELGIGAVVIGDFGVVRRTTVGGIAVGAADFGLAYSAEGYYQGGKTYGGVDIEAFMAGGELGYTAQVTTHPFLKGFAEYLSGDPDPNDDVERSFSTLYHTGHKFYGEMDFFLNLPVHTQKRGLLDAGGALGLSPAKGFGLQATFHHFRAAVERPDSLDTFGNELDAKLTYSPWSLLKLDFNYCFFAPGDVFTSGVTDPKLEHFVYSTGDFAF